MKLNIFSYTEEEDDKTKKTRIIGIFLIVILIVLGRTGAYLVKVNKEKSLNI
ncbi:hypothetical protein GCM10008914_21670 [Clostridium tertium]